jgi:hypothetical protein
MEFQDRELTCLDCGEQFTFKTGEQGFYWSKGLSEPKRCKQCRMIRRRNIIVGKEQQDGNEHRQGNIKVTLH